MSMEVERKFSYPIRMEAYFSNPKGHFYPSAYQLLLVRLFEYHLQNIEMDVPRLMRDYGVAWAILSFSLSLKRPFKEDDALHGHTWHSQTKAPLYRREFLIQDKDHSTVAEGAAFCTLLDVKSRHICRDPEILKHFQLPDDLTLLDADSRFREQVVFTTVEERQVRPSWIDCIGHVNNARYGDLAYDALTPEDRARMGDLGRIDIWFLREMTQDKTFLMQRAYGEDCIYVRGLLLPENKPSFVMKLSFRKDAAQESYCTILPR